MGGQQKTLALEAACLWRTQPHSTKVTSLVPMAGAGHLISGCDASAPARKPAEGTGEAEDEKTPIDGQPSVCLLDAANGKHLGSLPGMHGKSVSSLTLVPGQAQGQADALFCCLATGGSLWRWEIGSPVDNMKNPTNVLDPSRCAGTTQGQKVTEPKAADSPNTKEESIRKLPGSEQGQDNQSLRDSIFLKSNGYRGAREGALFRNGPWGIGYYSKEAVNQGVVYTVSATQPHPKSSANEKCQQEADPQVAEQQADSHPDASKQLTQQKGCPTAKDDSISSYSMMPADVRQKKQYIQQLISSGPRLGCSLLSSDASFLLTGSHGLSDPIVRRWEIATSSKGAELKGHSNNILCLALSPDQSTLFTGSYDCHIRQWDVATGNCIHELSGHRGSITGLVVSPDGSTLYSCSADNSTRVWDLSLGCSLRSMGGRHEAPTWPVSICLSPDGSLLATGSNGLMGPATIKIFHTTGSSHRDAGKCLATLCQTPKEGLGGGVSALAFSHCGGMLYSGGTDGSVAAWSLTTKVRDDGSTAFKGGFFG